MTGFEKTTTLVAGALLLLMSACEGPQPPRGADRGERLYETCVACHGEKGEGNELSGAPAIAGLPEWYLQNQINKFMSGARGTHPEDVYGMRMRPMSLALEYEGDPEAVVEYVASLPVTNPEVTLEGADPDNGKSLYATCSACHGPNAEGMQPQNAPPLVHSQGWYLVRQLKKFKHGIRGGDPSKDPIGNQMVAMAGTLADEQAMRDVVAYIETLSKK